jgi:hypothetical protein
LLKTKKNELENNFTAITLSTGKTLDVLNSVVIYGANASGGACWVFIYVALFSMRLEGAVSLELLIVSISLNSFKTLSIQFLLVFNPFAIFSLHSYDFVTTLYDFYGFKGLSDNETKQSLEDKIKNKIKKAQRDKIIPYISAHHPANPHSKLPPLDKRQSNLPNLFYPVF